MRNFWEPEAITWEKYSPLEKELCAYHFRAGCNDAPSYLEVHTTTVFWVTFRGEIPYCATHREEKESSKHSSQRELGFSPTRR